MTTTLEGGEGSASCPGRFLPRGKTRYPLYRRLGGPQSRSGQVRKISPSPGFDPRNVQPVASRYTGGLLCVAWYDQWLNNLSSVCNSGYVSDITSTHMNTRLPVVGGTGVSRRRLQHEWVLLLWRSDNNETQDWRWTYSFCVLYIYRCSKSFAF
jgi:hypothetical protein